MRFEVVRVERNVRFADDVAEVDPCGFHVCFGDVVLWRDEVGEGRGGGVVGFLGDGGAEVVAYSCCDEACWWCVST